MYGKVYSWCWFRCNLRCTERKKKENDIPSYELQADAHTSLKPSAIRGGWKPARSADSFVSNQTFVSSLMRFAPEHHGNSISCRFESDIFSLLGNRCAIGRYFISPPNLPPQTTPTRPHSVRFLLLSDSWFPQSLKGALSQRGTGDQNNDKNRCDIASSSTAYPALAFLCNFLYALISIDYITNTI